MSNSLNICEMENCSNGCFSTDSTKNPLMNEKVYLYGNDRYNIIGQQIFMLPASDVMEYKNYIFQLQLIKKEYVVTLEGKEGSGRISNPFFIVYLKKNENVTMNREDKISNALDQTFQLFSKCGLINTISQNNSVLKNLPNNPVKSNGYTHYLTFTLVSQLKLKDIEDYETIKSKALTYLKRAQWASILITSMLSLVKGTIITQLKKVKFMKKNKEVLLERIIDKYINFINKNLSLILKMIIGIFESENNVIEKCNNYFYNIFQDPNAHQNIKYKGSGGVMKEHKFVILDKLFSGITILSNRGSNANIESNENTVVGNYNNSRSVGSNANTVVNGISVSSNNIVVLNYNEGNYSINGKLTTYQIALDEMANQFFDKLFEDSRFKQTLRSMLILNLESNNKNSIYTKSVINKNYLLKESIQPFLNSFRDIIESVKINNSNMEKNKKLLFEYIKKNILLNKDYYDGYNLLDERYDENIHLLETLFTDISSIRVYHKTQNETPRTLLNRMRKMVKKNVQGRCILQIKGDQIFINNTTKNMVTTEIQLSMNINNRGFNSDNIKKSIHNYVISMISNIDDINSFVNKYNQEIDNIKDNIIGIILYKYIQKFEELLMVNKKVTQENVTSNKSVNNLLRMLRRRRNVKESSIENQINVPVVETQSQKPKCGTFNVVKRMRGECE
jgi:hypothetical protein